MNAVSLVQLTEAAAYLKGAYVLAVAGSLILGILTLALQNCRHAFWGRHRQMLSLGWNAAGVLLFIISQQPYAAALLFLFLVIKALMAEKRP